MKRKNHNRYHFTVERQPLGGGIYADGFRLLTLLVLSSTLCQCTHVPLMKRGRLAEYTMSPDRDPLSVSLGEHAFFSREAASGGRAIGGGGCGCN